MKLILLAIVFAFVLTGSMSAQSAKQNAALDQKIRKLEQAQVDSLLRGDITALAKNWAEDYTVNNPRNLVSKARQGQIYDGTRTYSSFVRAIEKVLIHGKTIIVMGQETVVPTAGSLFPDAGKTVNRRFTDIWMKSKGQWLLTARQASIICQH